MAASVRRWLTASPAWPAPMTRVWVVDTGRGSLRYGPAATRPAPLPTGSRTDRGSTGVDLDGDGDAVGQHVEDGRPLPGLLDDGGELLGIVAAEAEAHLDLLVTVADLVGEAEDPEQVDVALHRRLDGFQVDAACGGDVGDAGGQAGGQRVEQELHGRGTVVVADEHGRVVGVEGEGPLVGHVLHGAVEAVQRRAVVGAAH